MRDLGGVIVMDFIDMRNEKNRRAVEKELKDVMKGDRAKNRVLRINSFGILQMTRQRLGPSLKHNYYRNCPHCDGLGMIKSEESQALVAMRLLARAAVNDDVSEINIKCSPQVAHYLANYQRKDILLIEEETKKRIFITADSEMTGDDVQIDCVNARGSKVAGDTGKRKKSKLKTAAIEAFLKDHAKKTGSAKSSEDAPDEEAPPKSKKTRRRKKSGSAKKAAEAKEPAETKTESAESEETTDKKPSRGRKSRRKKSVKPEKPDKKEEDA